MIPVFRAACFLLIALLSLHPRYPIRTMTSKLLALCAYLVGAISVLVCHLPRTEEVFHRLVVDSKPLLGHLVKMLQDVDANKNGPVGPSSSSEAPFDPDNPQQSTIKNGEKHQNKWQRRCRRLLGRRWHQRRRLPLRTRNYGRRSARGLGFAERRRRRRRERKRSRTKQQRKMRKLSRRKKR